MKYRNINTIVMLGDRYHHIYDNYDFLLLANNQFLN